MDADPLTLLARPKPGDRAGLLEAAEILAGPVHRLHQLGADPEGDRARCRKWLDRILGELRQGGEDERRFAALGDWWLHAAFGDGPLGEAWRVHETLPAWLGGPLRSILDRGGGGGETPLAALVRPVRFQEARARLKDLLEHHVTIKKTPGPEIYREARTEAYEILNRPLDRGPPERLKLLDADCEDWACETRGPHNLDRGLKVWNTLVKHLKSIQTLAKEVVASWTLDPPPGPLLPTDWARRIDEDFAPRPGLARAFLASVTRLSGELDGAEPLDPLWLLSRLQTIPPGLDRHDRVRLLAVAREALAAEPSAAAPEWVAPALDTLQGYRDEIRNLRNLARTRSLESVVEELEFGLQELEGLNSREADDWIRGAREEVEKAAKGEKTVRLQKDLAILQADLEAAGGGRLEGPLEEVREAWEKRKGELSAALERLAAQVERMPRGETRDRIARGVEEGGSAIRARTLGKARRAADEALAVLEAFRHGEEARFGTDLSGLEDRADGLFREVERPAAAALFQRIRARAEAQAPYSFLIEATDRLLTRLEENAFLKEPVLSVSTAQLEGGLRRVLPVCWAETGIALDPTRLASGGSIAVPDREAQLGPGMLLLVTGDERPSGAIACRVAGPCPPGRYRALHDRRSLEDPDRAGVRERLEADRGVFFVSDPEGLSVEGPFLWREGRPRPADRRGFVARLDLETFRELHGLVEFEPPAGASWRIVPDPPDLDDLLEQGAEPVDRLNAESIEVWLAGVIEDSKRLDLRALARLVERLASEPLPEPLLARRLAALETAIETSKRLAEERRRAAEAFLLTDEGKREVERAAARQVADARERVDREVEAYRRQRLGALAEVERQIEEAGTRLASAQAEEEAAQRRREEIDLEIETAATLLADRKTRLLAEILGSRPGDGAREGATRPISAPAPAATPPAPLRAEPLGTLARRSLPELVAELDGFLPLWSYHDVANFVASIVSGPWTLFAGPPGVGKSTLARQILAALGHGPRTPRYLELVVRRDWQDDAALFGFWHPDRQAWEPGSEGLLELLIRAEDDWRRELGGLYGVVLEELNLAPPEYYLSRLVSALESPEPVIRLFGQEAPGPWPNRVSVHPNLRLLGTVNVDETVERLSPRFLSRASVLWIEPPVEDLLSIDPPEVLEAEPVDWAGILAAVDARPVPELGPLADVVTFLHEKKVAGAPSPRTVLAMRRYLAATADLLPPDVARDHLVLQRVLPSVRGVGPATGEVLEELARRLRLSRWTRAAGHCERIRERGKELGDYYDFFHA